ncbi:MAG: hypothetical protein KJ927_00335, partial [Candidatus Eisenbacteria bacterium]|nr:hypothetical protein [Candidatus Eisenbacteria bacterium]
MKMRPRGDKIPKHGKAAPNLNAASKDVASADRASGDISNHELARWCAREAVERKGEDVLLLDLREISSVCDFFVVIS